MKCELHHFIFKWFQRKSVKKKGGGCHLGGSVTKRLTLAQVMISQFASLSPASGSVLAAQTLEPVLDSVSLSFSLCPSSCMLACSLKNKR